MLTAPEAGERFCYIDADHQGYSYSPYDDLSGIYEVMDASEYPRRVAVRLMDYGDFPHDGTSAILNWDAQEAEGLIERLDS